MKTIILASGTSARLLPLTQKTHQCLLKIKDKRILEIQLELLKASGLNDFTLISGYFADLVEEVCKELNVKMVFNPFYEYSGTALTLWFAEAELKNGFLMIYSDLLFDLKVLKEFLKNNGDVCLAVKMHETRGEAEKVVCVDGIIKQITKNNVPYKHGEFIGMAKFTKSGAEKIKKIIHHFSRTNLSASFVEVIEELIKQGETINSYNIGELNFVDIDFPDDLKMAENLFT